MTTPTLTASSLHTARRLSWGYTPELGADITAAGGGRAWLDGQLKASVPDAPGAAVAGWYPSLAQTPQQIYDRDKSGAQPVYQVMYDLSRASVARRIVSKRQVFEQLVDFWSNLLHIPLLDDRAWFHRADYDATLRAHTLGTFTDLLTAAVTHPCMGMYLDNASSTKTNPNENLGRELLELHTVGIDGGYTEADVKASARILTGYRTDVWYPSFQSFYDTTRHYVGPVTVMGFSDANASADGRATARAYLSYLAHHPATAKRIARRLCLRFVSDTPSDGLVAAVAKAFTDNDTAIVPTVLAMVDHPEFTSAPGRKVRTPQDDYAATVRSLGVTVLAPTSDQGFAKAMFNQFRALGMGPFEWPAPDGFPLTSASYCSAGRVLTMLDTHRNLACQYYPTKDVTYRALASWLPTLPATLDQVITHVGLQVLGETPRTTLRRAIAQALGWSLDRQVTDKDAASYWTVRIILTSLLDSPQHLTR